MWEWKREERGEGDEERLQYNCGVDSILAVAHRELPSSPSLTLLPYISSPRFALADPRLPGSGKTAIFTSLIHRLPTLIHPHTKQEATKVLIVVGAIQLAKQAVETVRRAYPELEVELEQGHNRASGKADVTVATYQVGAKWARGRLTDPS